ncbi:MAG: septal ring lytic transglycosylase RlpA family protein [Arenicellaceae bacterium]|nr:septal ring lytic transglycosylase RlpA family protein [Arenicellaceae bacterium]
MRYVFIIAVLFLNACGGGNKGGYFSKDGPPRMSVERAGKVPDAIPKDEPLSETGNSTYSVYGVMYRPVKDARGYVEQGAASWYGKMFHGRRTSSGEIYDMYAMTAAHKTLPLPSYVRVTNTQNQTSVVVKVNDRGPFLHGRIIDLSYAAAAKLDMIKTGTADVEIKLVTAADTTRTSVPVRDAINDPLASAPAPVSAYAPSVNAKPIVRSSELDEVATSDQRVDNTDTGIYQPTVLAGAARVAQITGTRFQVGAYSIEENAKVTRDRLSEAGFLTVRIISSEGADGWVLHKVLLGPFTEDSATSVKLRLEQEGYQAYEVKE